MIYLFYKGMWYSRFSFYFIYHLKHDYNLMFSSFKSKFIWWWNYSSVILEMGRAALKFKIFFDKSKFCRNFFCLLVLASSHHELALFSSCASALLTNHLLALFFSEPLPLLAAKTTITQTVFWPLRLVKREWNHVRFEPPASWLTCMCCIFQPEFGCCAIWMLVQICFFIVFRAKKLKKKEKV